MHNFTFLLQYKLRRSRWLLALLVGLLAGPVLAGPQPNSILSLATALNPDGTLRPGATGSFDAHRFSLRTAPDGRPVFRPAGPGDEGWQNGFTLPNGTNGVVRAVVRIGTDVYIGGAFSLVANQAVNNIAKWNGTTWSTLGMGPANGVNGVVFSLAVSASGDLYAGGSFTEAGGVNVNHVARWNGTAWSALGAGTSTTTPGREGLVQALALAANGDLYAGGDFTQAGGVAANGVARWNGTAWSALGTGTAATQVGGDYAVECLAVAANGDLYAGGGFTQAGSVLAGHVARWNGSAWSSVGVGVGPGTTGGYSNVKTLAIAANGDVYVGGSFAQAGSTAARGVARWNGSVWNALGGGLGNTSGAQEVYALALAANGDVYAGGNFLVSGGVAVKGMARWNGTAWNTLGPDTPAGIKYSVNALSLAPNGELYAGGDFAQVGGVAASTVARWNGTTWSALSLGFGNGVYGQISALAVAPNGDVYAAGSFSAAGGALPGNVARWNGTAWTALGTGTSGGIRGMATIVSALAVASNGDLYAGGMFTAAGGVPASCVARWNGSAWSSLGSGSANGLNDWVLSLTAAPNGDVYAGGYFSAAGGVPANYVARWNGAVWNSLGTGVGGSGGFLSVAALAVAPTGDLYAAGNFTTAGGIAANHVARWNGSVWSSLDTGAGNGLPGTVGALTVAANGDLYAAGGSAAGVSRWNGAAWSSLGTTNISSAVTVAVAANGDVYAGCLFNPVGNPSGPTVTRWNGTAWNTLGTGLNNSVLAMAVGAGGKLYAGGNFTGVGDGSKMSVGFAVYDPLIPLAVGAAMPPLTLSTLYPNPARSTVVLTLPATAQARLVQLFDAAGREVRRQKLSAHAIAATLDLRGLTPGLYVVHCGTATSRLVVE